MEILIVLDMEDFMILFSTVLFGILMGGLLVGEDLIRSTLLSAIMADFIIPMDSALGMETVGEIAGGIVLTAGIASVIITEMILTEEITAIIALL
jgi:hypothetical protein